MDLQDYRIIAELAAGAILYRYRGGRQEFALIYRQQYDDWTLPKGHIEPGESLQETAIRETREETGWQAVLQTYAGKTEYDFEDEETQTWYWRGVHWFLAEATELVGVPDTGEVQAVEWLDMEAAAVKLSFPQYKEILYKAQDFTPQP